MLLSLVNQERLQRVLQYILDEAEFLSPFGVRSLSRYHVEHPFTFDWYGQKYVVSYQPAESGNGEFGGNSNWRGPIWFPINFLLIESLQTFYDYYGDAFKVEYPSHSGNWLNLKQVAIELSKRLIQLFQRDQDGHRPVYGGNETFQSDPNWYDLILFYEYFHGDNGIGLGAAHQTGWTALVAKLIQQVNQQ
ncbi:MAG: hypothetical protein Kow00121_12000 [Elainellaceae cyanobacterium]